jgi:hypothetical protein
MTGKMDWGRANRERRMWDRGVSNVADEKDWFERDRTARWFNRPLPAKPTHQQQRKPKSGNGKTIIIPGYGDPCPRCGVPMEIREHNGVGEKQLRQPYYYTRWFYCMNKNCKTKPVMPERYKVTNPVVGSDTWPDNTTPPDNITQAVMHPEPADPNERPPWE